MPLRRKILAVRWGARVSQMFRKSQPPGCCSARALVHALSVIYHNDIDIIMYSPIFHSLPIVVGRKQLEHGKSDTQAPVPWDLTTQPQHDGYLSRKTSSSAASFLCFVHNNIITHPINPRLHSTACPLRQSLSLCHYSLQMIFPLHLLSTILPSLPSPPHPSPPHTS